MPNNELPKRKHPRLKQYDYSANGYYFVTICCKDMKCFFGKITHIADSAGCCLAPNERVYNDTILTLSPYGQIAEKQLFALEERYDFVTIDKYVIMPNHIHAILILDGETAGASPRPTLSDIICAYKSLTTRNCNKLSNCTGRQIFQNSFYDRILPSEEGYLEVWQYIDENPRKWQNDEYYT
ncbi:MAG: transposase [Candidatus Fimenecus sp.]